MFRWSRLAFGGLVLLWVGVAAAGLIAQSRGGNPVAAKVKNPAAVTAASIKTGEQLFQKNCQFCHGATGLGDGKLAPKDMKPANLTDATWDRGDTDGEIHAIVLGGIPEAKMPGVKGRVSDMDAWHIVNYVRSLGPKAATR